MTTYEKEHEAFYNDDGELICTMPAVRQMVAIRTEELAREIDKVNKLLSELYNDGIFPQLDIANLTYVGGSKVQRLLIDNICISTSAE